MTYYESAEGLVITHKRALLELREHGIESWSDDMDDFYELLGRKEKYDATDVLEFLGY